MNFAVCNATTGATVAHCVVLAGTSAQRRTGLRLHRHLEDGHGLWIAPCEAIHTFGMRFKIDAVFIDRDQVVRKVCSAIPPRRIAWCLTADSVLELAEGAAARSNTLAGHRLLVQRNLVPAR